MMMLTQPFIGRGLDQKERFAGHAPQGHIGFVQRGQRCCALVDGIEMTNGVAKQRTTENSRDTEKTACFIKDLGVPRHRRLKDPAFDLVSKRQFRTSFGDAQANETSHGVAIRHHRPRKQVLLLFVQSVQRPKKKGTGLFGRPLGQSGGTSVAGQINEHDIPSSVKKGLSPLNHSDGTRSPPVNEESRWTAGRRYLVIQLDRMSTKVEFNRIP